MDGNPVIEMMGRRLRLGVIGGGPGSFIGSAHRSAARLDDRYELVASALSSDAERSRAAGRDLGLPDDRAYGDAFELLEAEARRDDGADVIAIMTPNDSHHPLAMRSLSLGFDVICDKPITNTVDEALDIVHEVTSTGLVFCLTHNYTGYAMVRQARAMVEDGMLGSVRMVQVDYVQGGAARSIDLPSGQPLPWRHEPRRSGPSLVMGDIGTHAHNLVRFVTGLEVAEVAAEVGHVVPDRNIDDFAGAMLRFDNGARGSFWVTQAAAGVLNSIRLRVSGALGTIEWQQEEPARLLIKPLDGPAQVTTPNGPGVLPLAAHSSRMVAGHPEGFLEGFANVYSDAAEAIAARRSGRTADPLALHFPDATDGALGMLFVDAVISSSENGGAWTGVMSVLHN